MKRKRDEKDKEDKEDNSLISKTISTITNSIGSAVNMVRKWIPFQQQPTQEEPPQNQEEIPTSQPSTHNPLFLSAQNKTTITSGGINYFDISSSDIIYYIFKYLPRTSLQVRQVNKNFYFFWESATKFKLIASTPSTCHLTTEAGFDKLIADQKDEIEYLTKNEKNIINKNHDASLALKQLFEKLNFLKDNPSIAAYHAREKCLNDINTTIVRNNIALSQGPKLNLNKCHLTRLPDELFKDAALHAFWSALTDLMLSNNNLTTLPDTIGQCTALEILWLTNNKLTTLPGTIGQCTALKRLYLVDNNLTTLPDTIGQCTELWWLVLDNNKLITLPDTIGQCTELDRLSLYNNNLTTLPGTISLCANLTSLFIIENNLSTLPHDLREEILINKDLTKITKAICLASQKKPLVEHKEEKQEQKKMGLH